MRTYRYSPLTTLQNQSASCLLTVRLCSILLLLIIILTALFSLISCVVETNFLQTGRLFPSTPPAYYGGDRINAVRLAFRRAFRGYQAHAWGHDEVRPVTGGWKGQRNNWGATIFDALDTLIIMNLTEEFKAAREHVKNVRFTDTDDYVVQVFETTIRYLGGLISAYDLTKDKVFIDKAVQLADILLPAFDTPFGIPLHSVDIKAGKGVDSHYRHKSSSLAEIGSLQLEFRKLSEITGNNIYDKKAQKVIDILKQKKSELALPGLYPIHIDPYSLKFTTTHVTWGGHGDSFYEYLLKHYLLTNGERSDVLDMWKTAVNTTKERLISGVKDFSDLTFVTQWKDNKAIYKMEHLACFMGGNILLGGKALKDNSLIELGLNLTESCYRTCYSTATGLGPEIFAWIPTNGKESLFMSRVQRKMSRLVGFYPVNYGYYLRPEVIESLFYAYRITGNAKYQDWGWEIFKSIERYCSTEIAYSGINDVSDPMGAWDDTAESFFYAETLKYLYLLFSDVNVISLDEYVLNTEAHPFKIISH